MEALVAIQEEESIDDIIHVRISSKLPQFDSEDGDALYYINIMSDCNVIEDVIVDSSEDGSEGSSKVGEVFEYRICY
jgi:hypothetical protein